MSESNMQNTHSPYTPTTEEVRRSWERPYWEPSRSVEFNRWLRQVKAEAWDEGWYAGYQYGMLMHGEYRADNPYREETE